MSTRIPMRIPEGETPTIRLPRNVSSDFPIGPRIVAAAGVHKAYMNRLGAVSVIATNGEALGIRPEEMEWIEGKPSLWCEPCPKGSLHVIEPYEGDWTLAAMKEKMARIATETGGEAAQ